MDDILRKVQGLLAKAEGTDNENEAAAFFAKAQQLIEKYAIDEARVREQLAKRGQVAKPVMVKWEYSSSDSNAKGKLQLLNVIAVANRVRLINLGYKRGYAKRLGLSPNVAAQWCAMVGYEADVELTKVMYASLLAQSARLGRGAFKETGRASGFSRFLTSYLYGFSETIRNRFAEQGRAEPLPADQMALVVRIKEEVDDATREHFPNLKTVGFSIRDHAAVGYGRRDGARADIGNPGLRSGGLQLKAGRR